MAQQLTSITYRSTKADGTPNALGTVATYLAGTLTNAATYTTAAGDTANTNPVTLGADGCAQIWLDPALSYRFIESDADGVPIPGRDVSGLSAPVGVSAADLASAAVGKGSKLVAFIQRLTGAVARWVEDKLGERVSVLDFGADPTGAADSTAAIQAAIDAAARVHIPAGVYKVSPVTGLVLKTGTHLIGDGKNKTLLVADSGGGSVAQIAAYAQGSIIRRSFNPLTANDYVNECYLADFSVLLTHPTGSVTTTAVQVGIDLRNVTRSIVERVHVGNIPPLGGPVSRSFSGNYEIQGYGILLGNVPASNPAYAGGEVNTLRDCSIWGAFKLITLDDLTLCPLSAALATTVVSCDLQAGHHLLVQEDRYTTGCAFRDNVLQNVKKKPGDTSDSYVLRVEGYNNECTGGYIEAGNGADYLLRLGALSLNNRIRLTYYSATSAALISDAGTRNEVSYFENSGSIPGGVDSSGANIIMYDQAYVLKKPEAWAKFHWDGSAVVIDASSGIQSITRTGAGDYTLTWTKTFPTDDYMINVALDTNVSGNGGTFSVGSHSTSNMRLFTYAQNAGTTTAIDPRFVWVRAEL